MVFTMSLLKRFYALYTISICLPIAHSHMQMSEPLPLRSPLGKPSPNGPQPDYNMIAPLKADGSDYSCKNYQWSTPLDSVRTYQAGQTYNMSVQGGATHEGGSCQLSLSYDNGLTFRTIKSIIGGCPIKKSYDFRIPKSAPSGKALFAWTWFNKVGNREMYMNCASVTIKNTLVSNQRTAAMAFQQLPEIFVANLADVNNCKVQETKDVHFPNAGTDVEYGSDASTAASGQTYTGGPSCDGVGRQSGKNASPAVSGAPSEVSGSAMEPQTSGSGDNGQWQPDSSSNGQQVSNPDSSSSGGSSSGGDDGQWHPDSNSQPAASGAANLNDGQWHPEAWGWHADSSAQVGAETGGMGSMQEASIPSETLEAVSPEGTSLQDGSAEQPLQAQAPPHKHLKRARVAYGSEPAYYSAAPTTTDCEELPPLTVTVRPECSSLYDCDGCASPSRCVKLNPCTTTCTKFPYTPRPPSTTWVTHTPWDYGSSDYSYRQGPYTETGYGAEPAYTPPAYEDSSSEDSYPEYTAPAYAYPSAEESGAPAYPSAPYGEPPYDSYPADAYPADAYPADSYPSDSYPTDSYPTDSYPTDSPSSQPADQSLPYSPSNPNTCAPCHPGTFLCTSPTSFYTCGQFDGSTDWSYGAYRDVADGTQCLPQLSPDNGVEVEYWRRPSRRADEGVLGRVRGWLGGKRMGKRQDQCGVYEGYYRDDEYTGLQDDDALRTWVENVKAEAGMEMSGMRGRGRRGGGGGGGRGGGKVQ